MPKIGSRPLCLGEVRVVRGRAKAYGIGARAQQAQYGAVTGCARVECDFLAVAAANGQALDARLFGIGDLDGDRLDLCERDRAVEKEALTARCRRR